MEERVWGCCRAMWKKPFLKWFYVDYVVMWNTKALCELTDELNPGKSLKIEKKQVDELK